MTRTLWFFMWGAVLLSLTSCGHEQPLETVMTSKPSTPLPKKKPVAPPPAPIVKEPLTHKIGLLLPLTGSQADLGKGLLQAAELALFEVGPSSSVVLLPQDTNQGGAHQAAMNALNEGAELLLGPVFSSEVEAIRPLVASRNISLIAFSTNQRVAGNGVFILGFIPSQQVIRVAEFAKEKGISKFAALTPEDDYGKLVDQTLKQLEVQGKIELLGTTHYSKGDLLEGNPGNVRLLEDVALYKSKGVQALFIPEGGENLSHLINLLSPEMPLIILGSGQWDTPETLQLASTFREGFFASPNPQEQKLFESRFQKAYGYTPPRIASLAYDAVALSVALSEKGYSAQNLTFSQGFAGVDGLFRLTPQGLNERGLAILEVIPGGFKTLSPAPQTF